MEKTEALELPEDAGTGEEGEVRRWQMELDLAAKTERDWHKSAKKAIERYRNERKDDKDYVRQQYNIFWSNVDVLRPHLYGATPKADVRRRFRDPDPVGKLAAEITERALDYSIETTDFDQSMANVILDYLIPSRGVARVRFEPVTEPQEDETGPLLDDNGEPMETLAFAKVYAERVPWDRFRRGPGISWDEVPWVAYEHQLTRKEIKEKFGGEMAAKVQYDVTMDGVEEKAAEADPSIFKRVRLHEIWDKQGKEILWLAPSCKEYFLKREPDKMKLDGFFDCERPLYAVESGNSLIPIVEYDMYEAQAKELDRVTQRINKLIATLKQRGLYDSTIKEFKQVFSAGDNDMIATDSANIAMQAGGLDKAVWLMPIETAANVLAQLYTQRDQIKATIYELTGISDILRGQTDPDETLGAQQLKAQTGGMRIQRRQRDVQRFIRGLLRKMAEIICQNYTPEILSKMTGIKLPTAEEKAMAQMQPQPAQPGQPPAALQTQELLASPTWDDVMAILKNDLLRSFRIDIETDSTIAADQAAERQQVTELITGIGGFIENIGPAVENGTLSMDAAKTILAAALRRFKLGREVEDAIEHDSAQPQQQKPDPEMMKAQAQAQLEQAKLQGQMQLEQQKLQNQKELEQFKAQNEVDIAKATQAAQSQQDLASQQAEAARKERETELTHESDTKKILLQHQLEMEKIRVQNEARLHEIALTNRAKAEQQSADHRHDLVSTGANAAADMHRAEHAASLQPETHKP